jgi:queuine tRNA-ribosyltransferase
MIPQTPGASTGNTNGRLGFEVQATAQGSRARAARFRTPLAPNGEVITPVFMPVGTLATVKAQTNDTLKNSGSQVLLANTYHLMLRPGAEVFRKMGGIHKFMKWSGSVLTDSGGYQIFSLAESLSISDDGARFQNHLDLGHVTLTPELSIDTQKAIGSDIMMVLDQCIPSTAERALAVEAMERTHRWAKRSLDARGDSPQALFGIVQGALFPDLRKQSAETITEMPFDGYAIGGLAVGESRQQREDFTEITTEFLPQDRPRYLMGVGTPIDLLEAVHRGVDMFDCILPTAFAQQGTAFTSRGRIDLRRAVYRLADDVLDPACSCPTCETHSRAYLHHLVRTKEILGWHLIGMHNLHFYHRLTAEMRGAILENRFEELYRRKREELVVVDGDNPVSRPVKKRTDPPLALGAFEVITSRQGFHHIRHKASGELMHPLTDPMTEARELYVEQSGLARQLADDTAGELVLWDVGLGAATNALAAIECFDECLGARTAVRPMRVVSFEIDLDALKLAAMHTDRFQYLKHPAPRALIENSSWRSRQTPLQWDLVLGDFAEKFVEAPSPDLVYFDPFSFKTDSPLWTPAFFEKLHQKLSAKPVLLFTYSSSTAIRARLLAAGFYVGRGRGTGAKGETTIALNQGALKAFPKDRLLGADWLEKWRRSDARELAQVEDARIRQHPQFVS